MTWVVRIYRKQPPNPVERDRDLLYELRLYAETQWAAAQQAMRMLKGWPRDCFLASNDSNSDHEQTILLIEVSRA